MNKGHKELAEMLQEILEERGSISLHLSMFKKDYSPVSKAEAQSKAEKVAGVLGIEITCDESEERETGSFDIMDSAKSIYLHFSYIKEANKNVG